MLLQQIEYDSNDDKPISLFEPRKVAMTCLNEANDNSL